uniref:Reverse transcriptase n=1 Tax=Tanacetum cinerariifolium TaxID=118510 RepID=A0A6L2NQ27_TANCI|nr:reverse transcriptase [Tanacetum cinerariifolium]
MSVKYPTYFNLISSSEEQPNERTPSPPPRNKSLLPPQALSKFISSKSTHYTLSSFLSESPTPTHVVPPPKLYFVIPIKQEPHEIPPLQMSPNNPYVSTMDNWPSGPSNPSPPPRFSRPPLGFPNPPPEFEPLPSTQPLFVNINNNTPHLHNNAPLLENIHHPPLNLESQDFPNPSNILDFVHPNDIPHLHNMFCQCISLLEARLSDCEFHKVHDLMVDDGSAWYVSRIHTLFPTEIMKRILSIHIAAHRSDILFWESTVHGNFLNYGSIWQGATRLLQEFHDAAICGNEQSETIVDPLASTWHPPLYSFVKVNYDAAWLPSSKQAGDGCVARNSDGEIIFLR